MLGVSKQPPMDTDYWRLRNPGLVLSIMERLIMMLEKPVNIRDIANP